MAKILLAIGARKTFEVLKGGGESHLGQKFGFLLRQRVCQRGFKCLLRHSTLFLLSRKLRCLFHPTLFCLDYETTLLLLRDAGRLDRMSGHPFSHLPRPCRLLSLLQLLFISNPAKTGENWRS